jgi:hypothetical protein
MIAGVMVAPPLIAGEVSHGEMAGAIRSADYPCARVLEIKPAGDDAWIVQCNSGTFSVSRSPDGGFSVTRTAGEAAGK